jgi:hypothetical protein
LLDVLSEWQTLAGGSFTFLAAVVAWTAVQKQMTLTRELAASEIARKHSAARSNLPMVLSAMGDYAFAGGQIIQDCYGHLEGGHVQDDFEVPEFPSPPSAAIEGLTAIVEHSVDPFIADIVSDLLGEIQIANARVGRLHIRRERHGLFRSFLDEMAIDFADIHARVSDLFGYARRECDRVPSEPSLKSLLSSLRLIGFRYYNDYDRLELWVIAKYARRMIAFQPRSKSALDAVDRWRRGDEQAVLRHLKIHTDADMFTYKQFRYSALNDAIAYAAIDRA